MKNGTHGDEEFYQQLMDLVMTRIKNVDFSKDPEAVDPLIRSLTHAAAHLCLIGGVDLPSFIASCVSEAQEAAECIANAVRGRDLTKSLSDSLEDVISGITSPVKEDDEGFN